jgi:hypothetical protein
MELLPFLIEKRGISKLNLKKKNNIPSNFDAAFCKMIMGY